MNFREAQKWCLINHNMVLENDKYILFFDTTEDKNKYHECECGCTSWYEPIGLICYDKEFTQIILDDIVKELFFEVFELKDNKQTYINFERYKWVTKRGYKTKEKGYVYKLTTEYPYSGYMYIDDKSICPVWFKEDDHSLHLNDYGKTTLKREDIIGKTITIKDIHDIITGYKCRWPQIIGKEDWVIDVGEMIGSSSCAVCSIGEGCTKPFID